MRSEGGGFMFWRGGGEWSGCWGGGCILRVRHGLLGKSGNNDDGLRWQQVKGMADWQMLLAAVRCGY